MNAAAVCLFVFACVLFSEHDVAVASPALQPDRGKKFSDYELYYDDPMFKQMTLIGFYATRDKRDRELSLPPNLYDDSEPLLAKVYSMPIMIDQINDPDRLNQLFGTIQEFNEEISTPEAANKNMADLRSEEQAGILVLKDKKADHKFVGKVFNARRGKKDLPMILNMMSEIGAIRYASKGV